MNAAQFSNVALPAVAFISGVSSTRMMSVAPSISTSVPSLHKLVALATPETQGSRYSRATRAPCCSFEENVAAKELANCQFPRTESER